MATSVLFEEGGHKAVLLEDFGHGQMVQANQYVIIHDGHGIILDPGGHKVYNKALLETNKVLGKGGTLDYIFFSHQDPDIVAAANGWLLTTDAEAYVSELWLRFVPHFGVDEIVVDRLKGIPDPGAILTLGGSPLYILPGHFLHSVGNFQIYDPVSKILYTGDLGASLGMDYTIVPDFDAHLQYMEGFHKRYMSSNAVLRAWASMVKGLDIQMIAPQHGAVMQGPAMVKRFIEWTEGLSCGTDLHLNLFQPPQI